GERSPPGARPSRGRRPNCSRACFEKEGGLSKEPREQTFPGRTRKRQRRASGEGAGPDRRSARPWNRSASFGGSSGNRRYALRELGDERSLQGEHLSPVVARVIHDQPVSPQEPDSLR